MGGRTEAGAVQCCIVWVRLRRRPQAARLAALSQASFSSFSRARVDSPRGHRGRKGVELRQLRPGGHVHQDAGRALGVGFRRLHATYRLCCPAAGVKRTGPACSSSELELRMPCAHAAGRRVHSEWGGDAGRAGVGLSLRLRGAGGAPGCMEAGSI